MKKLAVVMVMSMVAASASATLLSYDGFDYPVGSLAGQNGGTGWGGAYVISAGAGVVAGSLDSAAFPHTPVGYMVSVASGRNVGTTIDMGAATTNYFSVLMESSGTDYAELAFRDVSGNIRLAFGIDVDDKFFGHIGIHTPGIVGGTQSSLTALDNTTYFIVAKLITVAGGGNDTIYVQAYAPGDTVPISEPGVWAVTGTGPTGIVIANMRIDALTGSRIDEIRIGESWEDVAVANTNSTPFAYELFDYSPGSYSSGVLDGGSGWIDGWSGAPVVLAESLNSAAYPPLPVGNKLGATAGIGRTIASAATVDLGAAEVRYYSVLMKTTASGAQANMIFSAGLGTYSKFNFGINTVGSFYIEVGTGSPQSTSAGAAVVDSVYFVVVRLVGSSITNNDKAYLKVYGPSDSVDTSDPATWTLIDTGDTGITISRLACSVALASIDEIRIGDTWGSVVPPPPPPGTVVVVR